jgi:hypothetical protein
MFWTSGSISAKGWYKTLFYKCHVGESECMLRAEIAAYEVGCGRRGHCSVTERGCETEGTVGEEGTKHPYVSRPTAEYVLSRFGPGQFPADSSHQARKDQTRVGFRSGYPSPSHVTRL